MCIEHECEKMPDEVYIVLDNGAAELWVTEYDWLPYDREDELQMDEKVADIEYCPFCGAHLKAMVPPIELPKLDCVWLNACMDGFMCRNRFRANTRCVLDEGGDMKKCEHYAKGR